MTKINYCDSSLFSSLDKCDPFVEMYIGNIKLRPTDAAFDRDYFDVARTMVTPLIKKNSTIIRIKVYDADYKTDDSPRYKSEHRELILSTNGTIASFMKKPFRCSKGAYLNNGDYVRPNCLEVDVIWQAERN